MCLQASKLPKVSLKCEQISCVLKNQTLVIVTLTFEDALFDLNVKTCQVAHVVISYTKLDNSAFVL